MMKRKAKPKDAVTLEDFKRSYEITCKKKSKRTAEENEALERINTNLNNSAGFSFSLAEYYGIKKTDPERDIRVGVKEAKE